MKKAAAIVALMGIVLLGGWGLGVAAQDQQPVQPPTVASPAPRTAVAPMAPVVVAPQPQMPGGQGGGRPAAVVLSIVMPGTGEWMNRDFEGPFPMLECCAGYLCPFFMWSSALDAAVGDRSDRFRFDFWTKPTPER